VLAARLKTGLMATSSNAVNHVAGDCPGRRSQSRGSRKSPKSLLLLLLLLSVWFRGAAPGPACRGKLELEATRAARCNLGSGQRETSYWNMPCQAMQSLVRLQTGGSAPSPDVPDQSPRLPTQVCRPMDGQASSQDLSRPEWSGLVLLHRLEPPSGVSCRPRLSPSRPPCRPRLSGKQGLLSVEYLSFHVHVY